MAQKNEAKRKPGRPRKPDEEKVVRTILYLPPETHMNLMSMLAASNDETPHSLIGKMIDRSAARKMRAAK